jgi:hypothetical protein
MPQPQPWATCWNVKKRDNFGQLRSRADHQSRGRDMTGHDVMFRENMNVSPRRKPAPQAARERAASPGARCTQACSPRGSDNQPESMGQTRSGGVHAAYAGDRRPRTVWPWTRDTDGGGNMDGGVNGQECRTGLTLAA